MQVHHSERAQKFLVRVGSARVSQTMEFSLSLALQRTLASARAAERGALDL